LVKMRKLSHHLNPALHSVLIFQMVTTHSSQNPRKEK
jgi:hypothetical protein